MEEAVLKKNIEALLFVSEKPLDIKQIADVFEAQFTNVQIKSAIKNLKDEYNNAERGIQIIEIAGGYQFSTNPACAEYLKKLYKTRRVLRLSGPALETVAIIAYKQPVTRSEIEFVRGVNVDGVIRTLLERGIIKPKGKKEVPGRPILYGTTDEFLKYFGLKSIQELPVLDSYTPQSLELVSKGELAQAKSEPDKVENNIPEPVKRGQTYEEENKHSELT